MEKYDAIIVGAGPAGSTTAKYAAQGGANVLVIERRGEIGVPVHCGEFLPAEDEMKKLLHDVCDFEIFDIGKNSVSRETDTLRLVSPLGKRFDNEFHGVVVDRKIFDKRLADDARKAGAEIMTGTRVTGIDGNKAETDKGDFFADVIVGADGPVSTVARFKGMQSPKELSPCYGREIEGDFEPVVEMHVGSVAPGGYAWIIPKKRSANVGVGIQKRFSQKSPRDVFEEFVSKRGIEDETLAVTGGLDPCSGPIRETLKGNTLLVGDAAGHVMASNGGGIPIARVCGKIAGETIAKHASKGTPLLNYEKEWKRQVGGPLANSLRAKRMADLVFRNDKMLDLSMRILGKGGINRVVTCRRVFGII
ncbi:MAG: hypothetical protein MSIBF_00065 [Candidatus Altiarchaeales archaeon IMC4]|nr:MAG: hypothetical protein MSIBF_00065 [Candidatus Altiarchaeales archaeon IMC4]